MGVANKNPLGTFEANIKRTWNLLEACRRVGDFSRIFITSSDRAYGDLNFIALFMLIEYKIAPTCFSTPGLTHDKVLIMIKSIAQLTEAELRRGVLDAVSPSAG